MSRALASLLVLVAACGGSGKDPTTTAPTGACPDGQSEQTWYADADGDGFGDDLDRQVACQAPAGFVAQGGDCDDGEALANPDGIEDCATPGIDEDCDGELGNNDATGALNAILAYPDGDNDGYGDANSPGEEYCLVPSGVLEDNSDCDDSDPTVSPDQLEVVCDGLDNDCDPGTLDGPDIDGDGFDACIDCDESDASVYPGAVELSCDGIDNDCDPATLDDPDDDNDGATFCVDDCDDTNPAIRPGIVEVSCDGLDNDCNPGTPDDADADADGVSVCSGDCDDTDPLVSPLAIEVSCDSIDNDCDPATIDGVDADGDGVAGCTGDCDDANPYVFPGNFELACDGLDNDCDPATPDELDGDLDGVTDCAGDCDDAEPAVFPGNVEVSCDGLDNDCNGATPDNEDVDADTWGICDGDCDDFDPAISPGAFDPLGDGIDQNCDGADGTTMYEDFELGVPNPAIWAVITGPIQAQTAVVDDGVYSGRLGPVSYLETWPLDTSLCTTVLVSFDGMRGPLAPTTLDNVHIDYLDNVGAWSHITYWSGTGVADTRFEQLWFELAGSALHSGFVVRLDTAIAGTYEFHIDDFQIQCDPLDTDGDSIPDPVDCEPLDPAHWADCGLCIDGDGDDYGLDCDLGDDCDDADAAINFDGVDLSADGIDQDCNLIDGPPLLFDDLELGVPDPAVWTAVTGDAGADGTLSYSGLWSLNLGGNVGIATTVAIDTSLCTNGVAWSYQGKRGPEQPDAGDFVDHEWLGGALPVLFDTWVGGATDPTFGHRSGVITDPAAQIPAFQIELSSFGSGANFDDFFIDDFAVGCAL